MLTFFTEISLSFNKKKAFVHIVKVESLEDGDSSVRVWTIKMKDCSILSKLLDIPVTSKIQHYFLENYKLPKQQTFRSSAFFNYATSYLVE